MDSGWEKDKIESREASQEIIVVVQTGDGGGLNQEVAVGMVEVVRLNTEVTMTEIHRT